MAIGGILRAAMMARDWGSVVRYSREISRNKQLLPVVNEFPLRRAHIARTKSRLSPEPWRGSVDRRVADNVSVQQVGAVDDELKASLLRRYNRGQAVPSWFEPTDSSALIKYNIERARAGLGGQGGQRVPVRSPAEAKRAYEKVASRVGATKVPYEKIREIQRLCGVQDNPRVCAKVADIIERHVGLVKTKGFYQNAQHSWNVMPDGTIVDATASQFGLPFINVVPARAARARGYRQMTPEQVRYMEEAHLQGFPVRDNLDWLAGDFGRRKFEIDPWIAEGIDYSDEMIKMGYEYPWVTADRLRPQLSRFFGMQYGQ